MKRFFWMLLAIAALGLVLGGACSKEEQDGGEGGSEEAAEEGDPQAPDEGGEDAPAEQDQGAAAEEEGGAEEGGDDTLTGVEACDSLIKKALECDKLPPATLEAYKKAAEGWKQAVEAGGEQARSTIEQSCEQAESAWNQAFENAGC